MRILIVTQYFWPETARVNDLAQAMATRGHRVRVLTGMPNYPEGRFYAGYGGPRPRRERWGEIEVLRVPIVPRGRRGRLGLPANYASFAAAGAWWGPRLAGDDFDCIFVYQPSPVTVALPALRLKQRFARPLMLWVQDLWPESLTAAAGVRSPIVLAATRRLVGAIYRRCERVLIQSEGFRASVVAAGADPRRVLYLPNWAEDGYRPLDPVRCAREDREMPQGFRIVYTGNIGAAQDFATILAAARRLQGRGHVHWIVFGDGRRRAAVEAEVRRRGLSHCVHLMGTRPAEAIAGYLAHADALLIGLRDEPLFRLTIPSKLQSYLACGRPIVGACSGIVADIVHAAGAGILAPAGAAEELARAVEALIAMPHDARREMGERARACFLAQFERARLLDRLEAEMEAVVAARAPRGRPLAAAAVSAPAPDRARP
jgi:glycosyltransferase involved in cell wall biosynthesis